MKGPKKPEILTLVLLALLVLLIGNLVRMQWVATFLTMKETRVVVIDPGHGGFDPGKVGVNDVLEKDVNLGIALKLKDYLEQGDVQVVMTRETDIGLYNESDTNKKRTDLNKRAEIIRESQAQVVVSIHQNSFSQGKYKGAQVFYYSHSEEGKVLAETLQDEFVRVVDGTNTRKAKANDSYFILKQTPCPAVIVESGFLSNWEEAELLKTEAYQDKIAWAIYMGIVRYLNTK